MNTLLKQSRTIANPRLAWPFTRSKPASKKQQLRELLKSLPAAPF